MRAFILFLLHLSFACAAAHASQEFRVAMWHSEWSQIGPGLLIHRLDEQDKVLVDQITKAQSVQADVLLLVNVDQDDERWAAQEIGKELNYKYFSQISSNRGLRIGLELNGDNWIDDKDRQGFAKFRGQAGMLLLSHAPPDSQTSFNELLMKNFSSSPQINGENYFSEKVWGVLRLSPTGLWDHDFGNYHILSAFAKPPAFDGIENRNAMRNAAELRWWKRYYSGEEFRSDQGEITHLDEPFILMGTLNLDPELGKGEREVIQDILSDERLNPVIMQRRATVDWREIGLGEMRVDYILPSCEFEVTQSGQIDMGTEHALIWADLKQRENCNWR